MEVQPQLQSRHLLHHNLYDPIKTESSSSSGHSGSKSSGIKSHTASCPQSDMLFGVNSFGLQTGFCPPATNNNHETVNHNHSKIAANADRKRPYPCNLCPSRFGSKMELEEHQNSHTGMKPFECDVCKARFNRRSTLWNHKRIHSDAKPFVCTVCQMTFKWKNSLKCHKEMHMRKNESSTVLDNDLRQLTYATAAKRRLMQMMEEGGDGTNPATSSSSTIHSQPLITTSSPKKKAAKAATQNNQLPMTPSLSLHTQQNGLNTDVSKGWLQTSLLQQNDHPLDLDTSTLDTLVQQSNQNLLVHLCNTDMDPRHATSLLSHVDDPNSMLQNHIFGDMKPDLSLLPSHSDLQFSYNGQLLQSPMGNGSSGQINVPIPIVGNLVNIPRLNGLNGSQQLPSVHHLTSTALPSVSANMDYSLSSDGIQSNIAHPQYVVTSQPDMMLSQPSATYQQQIDQQCVLIASGQDYVPNYDFNMLNQQYQMGESENAPQQMTQVQSQQNQQICEDSGKVLPFEQW